MKNIIFFLFPGIEILDFAGPLQTFVEAENRGCSLTVSYCSWQTEICASQKVFIDRLYPFYRITPKKGDIVVIPGLEHRQYTDNALSQVPATVFSWFRQAYRSGAELCSICTGAFILAYAGLLDGKRCTTHWLRTEELQKSYALIKVETNRLFVHDQGIYTSAGVASGIDLALALVEKHWGPQIASKVARDLVVYMRRDGSHHQDSVYLSYRDHINPVIHELQDWLISHPGDRPTIDTLADRLGLSSRNLTRLFKKATGITIKQYSILIRLEHARQVLKDPDNSVESVALQCGFHDAKQLRRIWKQHFGTTPGSAKLV